MEIGHHCCIYIAIFFRTFVVPLEVSLLLTGSPDLHSEVVTLSYMRYLID